MNYIRLTFLMIFLTLAGTLPAHAGISVGDAAPDFTLTTLDGQTFRLSDYKGKKPVHLIFWATWCPNCKHEIPSLKRIYHEFGDRMEILAINVSINDSKAKAKRYVRKYKLPYHVAFDEGAKVTRLYEVMGTPTQFVIDAGGVIRYRDAATPEDLGAHFLQLTAH